MEKLAVECANFPIRIYINCQIVYNEMLVKNTRAAETDI